MQPSSTRRFSRRRFLATLAGSSAPLLWPAGLGAAQPTHSAPNPSADLALLHEVAREVLESARIPAGGQIPNGPKNSTGFPLRVPGGTLAYYPAFWIRDAAMMLGADFVPADELEGWIRVVAATQPGPDGLRFGRLIVPPFSIPDHVTLGGEACWYPGAYTDQGNGGYGFLPPADDAFFFIQMVHEHRRLTGSLALWQAQLKTGWGEPRLAEICLRAFDSVAVDPKAGLVRCDSEEGRTRVDWGFCDAIRKTGSCLMPSLLRWRAAQELAALLAEDGDRLQAKRLRAEAAKIRSSLPSTFVRAQPSTQGGRTALMLSATEVGRKDDLWASAFAIWLGVLPRDVELRVARHLLELCEAGGSVVEGQVRHLPPAGEFGGHWEKASCPPEDYQNGGYWATPTGWMVTALRKVDRNAGDRLLADYVAHLKTHRSAGAPWEWIHPGRNKRVNALYGSSAGLVYAALAAGRWRRS